MRFGVFLLPAQFPDQEPGAVLRRAVTVARAAEQVGFDSVWVAEHHFMSYGVCPSAATLAGFLLGRTSTIEVGTAVSVLSTQHPVALAEQAAMLDALSGGRFTLGVGRGSPLVELTVFGTGMARYERGFGESLDLLLRGLRDGRVSGSGEFFDFDEVPLVPAPAKPPPVAVATTSAARTAMAAERGLPMLLGMHEDLPGKQAKLADYLRTGPADAEHIAVSVAQVADTDVAAKRLVRQRLPDWLGPGLAGYRRVDGMPYASRDPLVYTEQLCAIHPIGSVDYCASHIADTARRTGVRHQLFMVEASGEQDAILENVRRLGLEVLPKAKIQCPA